MMTREEIAAIGRRHGAALVSVLWFVARVITNDRLNAAVSCALLLVAVFVIARASFAAEGLHAIFLFIVQTAVVRCALDAFRRAWRA